jgi:hypothetical protein
MANASYHPIERSREERKCNHWLYVHSVVGSFFVPVPLLEEDLANVE